MGDLMHSFSLAWPLVCEGSGSINLTFPQSLTLSSQSQ